MTRKGEAFNSDFIAASKNTLARRHGKALGRLDARCDRQAVRIEALEKLVSQLAEAHQRLVDRLLPFRTDPEDPLRE